MTAGALALAVGLLLSPAEARRPLPPAPLPQAEPVEATEQPEPLCATANGSAEPAGATATLLEEPNGTLLDTWLELPHAFVSRQIFGIVSGFDRFFADERDLGTARSRSFIRLRGEVRVERDGTLGFGSSVRADLALPYIQKRLRRFRILLENTGRGLVDSEPRPLSGAQDGGRADAVLRFTLLDTLRSSIDLGGGVIFDLPPGVVGRTRFRYARALGRVALARVAATGYWNSRDGFGSNGSLAFERAIGTRLLLRWTTGTLVSQISHGYESASEVALLATLGPTTGLTLVGSASGASKPELAVQVWRTAARLRTSLYRRWIYGEIEPEVVWPRHDPEGRSWIPALIFRLEIQFEEARAR